MHLLRMPGTRASKVRLVRPLTFLLCSHIGGFAAASLRHIAHVTFVVQTALLHEAFFAHANLLHATLFMHNALLVHALVFTETTFFVHTTLFGHAAPLVISGLISLCMSSESLVVP